MNRQELAQLSEAYIKQLLKKHLPKDSTVYLYGSRARHDERWNSDYDLWIDAQWIDEKIAQKTLAEISDELEESFVPFKVDLVTTVQLRGVFGEQLKQEARRWM